MSIKDFSEKIKDLTHVRGPKVGSLSDDLFLGLIIILVAIGSFGLGRISKIEGSKDPIRIENEPQGTGSTYSSHRGNSGNQGASVLGATRAGDTLVAAKNGKKYYYPWCSGAQKISAENRVYFSSKADAEARGYTPSSTCKGL